MFSNTAYEALYEYIGLGLQQKFIEIICSQKVFLAAILLIFAAMFFTTTVQFFSRYLPGTLVQTQAVPLSRYLRLFICLILGISILRVGTQADVKKFDGTSWKDNTYVKSNVKDVTREFRVSLVFDILSRSAEEVTSLIARSIDAIFKTSHSQLEAPNFFYKAVMMAGSATITDPELKEAVNVYSSRCLMRVLPMVGNAKDIGHLDRAFRDDVTIDQKLSTLTVDGKPGAGYNCLQAKTAVRTRMLTHARETNKYFSDVSNRATGPAANSERWFNLAASNALLDHFNKSHNGVLGMEPGSRPQGGLASSVQFMKRLMSVQSLLSIFGSENHGAIMAGERAQEFSENLSRAPHIAGFIKLALFAIFPWLCFPIFAGKWKVLAYWYGIYFSVLMWTPIWTLLYHIMLSISLSTDTLKALGELSDGFSLYSASVVSEKMNYMFSVYSWLQVLVGGTFTGGFLLFLKPILTDSQTETAPEFVGDAASTAFMAGRLL